MTKHITLELPDDLFNALESVSRQAGVKSKRAFATHLLAQALGVAVEPPTWGGWQGNERSLDNLVHYADRLTDKGRNDPAEAE